MSKARQTAIGSAFVLSPRYLAVLSICTWPKSARTVCKSPVPFKMWRQHSVSVEAVRLAFPQKSTTVAAFIHRRPGCTLTSRWIPGLCRQRQPVGAHIAERHRFDRFVEARHDQVDRHDKATLRVLDGLTRGKVVQPAAEPKLMPGTVLMRWSSLFVKAAPPALTKDLLGRMIRLAHPGEILRRARQGHTQSARRAATR
jgi:hypothetical protein